MNLDLFFVLWCNWCLSWTSTVRSLQCDLTEGLHQLISNHSSHQGAEEEEDEAGRSLENVTISVSQFTQLAAGCVLHLTSPGTVCTAIRQGRWAEETEHFLHEITHGEHHEHQHEKSRTEHAHDHMDVRGLETVLQELQHHYEPEHSEVGSGMTLHNVVLLVPGPHDDFEAVQINPFYQSGRQKKGR